MIYLILLGAEMLKIFMSRGGVPQAAGFDVDAAGVLATIDMACREHRDHEPSMRQDMTAGRQTEIDALNGAIAAEAERLGVPAPINRALYRLVKLRESTRAG